MDHAPVTELDARYCGPDASPTSWEEAQRHLAEAEISWLTTLRAGGRPHVTPLLTLFVDGVAYFTTGPDEQKARNLRASAHCALTTGCNRLRDGLDLVVEGDATRVTDETRLRQLAEAFEAKYGSEWHFDVRDGSFHHDGGEAHVFAVVPTTAYGFRKGDYAHTRWRFPARA
jgi:nitroimidazol reductase NimA-like FMN-containing flavoprotein (pyridoxamine 5'-phosphate oxidase superfamily)